MVSPARLSKRDLPTGDKQKRTFAHFGLNRHYHLPVKSLTVVQIFFTSTAQSMVTKGKELSLQVSWGLALVTRIQRAVNTHPANEQILRAPVGNG